MKKNIYLLLIQTLIFFQFCVPKDDPARWNEHSTILFNNNSARNILIDASHNYPDTSLYSTFACNCSDVKPHTSCSCMTRHGWESEIRRNKHRIIIFFVYDLDTLRKYGPDICKKEYKILKRYELTQQMIENSNWTIN